MTFQGRKIVLESLTPVFRPEQAEAKHREIERQLYEVFIKYIDKEEGTDQTVA